MALRATLYKKPFQLCERTAVYKMMQISPQHGLSWKMGQVYVGYSAFYSSTVSVYGFTPSLEIVSQMK